MRLLLLLAWIFADAVEVEVDTHEVGNLTPFVGAALGTLKEIIIVIEHGRIDTAGRGSRDPVVECEEGLAGISAACCTKGCSMMLAPNQPGNDEDSFGPV